MEISKVQYIFYREWNPAIVNSLDNQRLGQRSMKAACSNLRDSLGRCLEEQQLLSIEHSVPSINEDGMELGSSSPYLTKYTSTENWQFCSLLHRIWSWHGMSQPFCPHMSGDLQHKYAGLAPAGKSRLCQNRLHQPASQTTPGKRKCTPLGKIKWHRLFNLRKWNGVIPKMQHFVILCLITGFQFSQGTNTTASCMSCEVSHINGITRECTGKVSSLLEQHVLKWLSSVASETWCFLKDITSHLLVEIGIGTWEDTVWDCCFFRLVRTKSINVSACAYTHKCTP